MTRASYVTIYQTPGRRNIATLTAGALRFQCLIGRSLMRPQKLKREGDGATPVGRFHPVKLYYRSDRSRRPRTGLPVQAIRPGDGWCDQPGAGRYNRPVFLPCSLSAEDMWRNDNLYDFVIELDHNRRPRIQGRGSAIFIHIASADCAPTAGCVALKKPDLEKLLPLLDTKTVISIGVSAFRQPLPPRLPLHFSPKFTFT